MSKYAIEKVKEHLKNGFITANSYAGEGYEVKIGVRTIEELHDLHRVLLLIRDSNPEPLK